MKATFSRHLSNTLTNFVRACSISAALLSCSLLPCSVSAEEVPDVVPLTLDDLDPDTRSAVVGLATSISGVNATQATVDDNVATILALLTSMRLHTTSGLDYMRTVPYYNPSANFYVPLGSYLRFGLGDWSGAPNQANSYLYQIQRVLYGTSGVPSSSDAIQPILSRILDKMNASSNVWTQAYIDTLYGELDALYELLDGAGYDINRAGRSLEVLEGTVSTNAYAIDGSGPTISVHDALLDDHLSSLYDMIQGALGSVDYNIEGVTDSLTSNELARSAALNATYSVGQVDEHADDCYDYTETDDTISTNDLDELEIAPGDTGDLTPVLDLVDVDSIDVLPSLTGGDPVVQVFTASRDSNLPEFSIDFSLPSGFRTFIHAVAVWIWRILFFVAMWRLVSDEYSYWSTLGGAG